MAYGNGCCMCSEGFINIATASDGLGGTKYAIETKRTVYRSGRAWSAFSGTSVASSSEKGLEPHMFHTILKLRAPCLTAGA